MTPSSIDKFQLLWDEFPDLRRHTRAVESLKAKQDPNYNYYETVFRNFNPDWKPPTKPTTAPFVRQANRSAHAPSTAPPGSTWEERAAAYTKRSEDAYFRDRPEMRAKP